MNTKPIIIANWKMNLIYKESIDLAKKIKAGLQSIKNEFEIVICPSYVALKEIKSILGDSRTALGAQDCFWEEFGAYTGEISPEDLKSVGCDYVILGHSERRKYLQETGAMIHKKVRIALDNKLIPVVCIGESWDERRENQKDYILIKQLTEALEGISLSHDDHIIVAYEPVWAISTGEGIDAEPQEVQYANEVIRQVLLDLYNRDIVNHNTKIIYGGSVDGDNVNSFMSLPNVSGALVGGASQKAEKFLDLIESIV